MAIGYVAYVVGVVTALALAGRTEPSRGVAAVVGLTGAVAVAPAVVVLRGVVDRLLFGDRPDPLRTATTMAGRVGRDPADLLEAVRDSLALPYAELRVDGRVTGSSGVRTTQTRSVPLALGGGRTGELVVGLRVGDLGLTRSDQEVLRLVAPLVSLTVRVTAPAADLAESRALAVATVEEERRRLRRDLHDGLGPALPGIAFSADAVLNSLGSDPYAAEQVLRSLRQDAADAVDEVRRLVYGMRPPALDELGLVPRFASRPRGCTARTAHRCMSASRPPGRSASCPRPSRWRRTASPSRRSPTRPGTRRGHGCGSRSRSPTTSSGSASTTTARRPTRGRPACAASMRERAAEVGGSVEWGPTPTGGRVLARLPLEPAGT